MLLVVCACCAVVLYRKVRPEAAKAMAAALLALFGAVGMTLAARKK